MYVLSKKNEHKTPSVLLPRLTTPQPQPNYHILHHTLVSASQPRGSLRLEPANQPWVLVMESHCHETFPPVHHPIGGVSARLGRPSRLDIRKKEGQTPIFVRRCNAVHLFSFLCVALFSLRTSFSGFSFFAHVRDDVDSWSHIPLWYIYMCCHIPKEEYHIPKPTSPQNKWISCTMSRWMRPPDHTYTHTYSTYSKHSLSQKNNLSRFPNQSDT